MIDSAIYYRQSVPYLSIKLTVPPKLGYHQIEPLVPPALVPQVVAVALPPLLLLCLFCCSPPMKEVKFSPARPGRGFVTLFEPPHNPKPEPNEPTVLVAGLLWSTAHMDSRMEDVCISTAPPPAEEVDSKVMTLPTFEVAAFASSPVFGFCNPENPVIDDAALSTPVESSLFPPMEVVRSNMVG